MRNLFALSSLAFFLSSSNLAAQIIPPQAYRQQAADGPGIYLVTFRPDTPASQRAAVVQASGARFRMIYNAANSASVAVPDAAALARLRSDRRVLSVFANRPITLLVGQGHGGGNGNGGSNSGSRPKAPANLGTTAISSSQITLAWTDNSDNESGFAIERCAGSGCANFSEISRVGANVTTYGDLGLTAQTVYRYRALAFNAGGSSKYSNIAEATTPAAPPPPPPPSAPSNLTSSVVSNSQVNLNWFDSSGNEDGFRLDRCTGTQASCADANFP